MAIPVIDLFAGPGGLSEGFSRSTRARFEVAVSIEKDGQAFETLRLRAAHRALSRTGGVTKATWAKWDDVVATSPWNIVFHELRDCGDPLIHAACVKADGEAWNLEMGPHNREQVAKGIRKRLREHTGSSRIPTNSVLIGGPPCQAYSLVGRARNRGKEDYRPEEDHRHFLYQEYLNVINEFRPAVFVMENVKGILTSRVDERRIFETILADLRRPDLASGNDSGLRYVLHALPSNSSGPLELQPEDFLVRAEEYGIPQARHRVIICGIRKDVYDLSTASIGLHKSEAPSVLDVIGDLPPLRSRISHRGNGMEWRDCFDLPLMKSMLQELRRARGGAGREVAGHIERIVARTVFGEDPGTGDDRRPGFRAKPIELASWYLDRPNALLVNHASRAHMPSDVLRYLFVAAFGEWSGYSPKLADFPSCLLPEHENIDRMNIDASIFKDRFRVQVGDRFSTTVTSHIAKDGHAFIHPDARQCRSLSVREAARLQTFPDSYVFLGNRTSQYTQVGNAVPPLLASQIADQIARVLDRTPIRTFA